MIRPIITLTDTTLLFNLAQQQFFETRKRAAMSHLAVPRLLSDTGLLSTVVVNAVHWEATGKMGNFQEDLDFQRRGHCKNKYYGSITGLLEQAQYFDRDGNRRYKNHYQGRNELFKIVETGSPEFGEIIKLVGQVQNSEISRQDFIKRITLLRSQVGDKAIKYTIRNLKAGNNVYVVTDDEGLVAGVTGMMTQDNFSVGAVSTAAYFQAACEVPSVKQFFDRQSPVKFGARGELKSFDIAGKKGNGAGEDFASCIRRQLVPNARSNHSERARNNRAGGWALA